uniref:Uncharacterized protein n=1 Tax=Stigonema sp. PCC 9446 TaxID=2099385 RepID=A0A2P0ZGM2_9CYAN|nr:hypothetical protein [Stigonema sp. PCC 9446]
MNCYDILRLESSRAISLPIEPGGLWKNEIALGVTIAILFEFRTPQASPNPVSPKLPGFSAFTNHLGLLYSFLGTKDTRNYTSTA